MKSRFDESNGRDSIRNRETRITRTTRGDYGREKNNAKSNFSKMYADAMGSVNKAKITADVGVPYAPINPLKPSTWEKTYSYNKKAKKINDYAEKPKNPLKHYVEGSVAGATAEVNNEKKGVDEFLKNSAKGFVLGPLSQRISHKKSNHK